MFAVAESMNGAALPTVKNPAENGAAHPVCMILQVETGQAVCCEFVNTAENVSTITAALPETKLCGAN